MAGQEKEQVKQRNYNDRFERYAEARKRNRRRACREAGSELRNLVAQKKQEREGEESESNLRRSA